MEQINKETYYKQKKENTTTSIEIKPLEELINIRYENRQDDKKDMPFGDYSDALEALLETTIPPRFHGAKITEQKIKDFLYKNNLSSRGIYLYGDCGVGKTRNLYGVYKTLKANIATHNPNWRIRFTNINDFFSELKQTFDDYNSELIISEWIKTGDILFLDDFGSEKQSEWTLEATYRLINHRYEYMKPTFISSNLSLSELSEKIGDRVTSRIVEMCEIIKIEGEDKRLQ